MVCAILKVDATFKHLIDRIRKINSFDKGKNRLDPSNRYMGTALCFPQGTFGLRLPEGRKT